MRYLSLLLLMSASSALAAPVATPTEKLPDATHSQIRYAEPKSEMQPENQAGTTPPSMTSEEFLQHPDLLQNALDTAVNQQNIATIRFLLPLYQKLPENQQDKVLAEFAHSFLDRADNNYNDAEQRLRGLLQTHPHYAPIRLQLALTLWQSGQQREAAEELQHVKNTAELPQHITQLIQQFEHHLERAKSWQFSGNAHYLREKNVGRTPEQRTYGFWRFPEPRSAHGIGYDVSAQKTIPIRKHWAARVHASVSGKFYWDAHDHDDLAVRTEAGAVWRDAKQEAAFMPYYEKRWFGTRPYSDTVGGGLQYSRTLSPKWQMFAAVQSGYRHYKQRKYLEGSTNTLSLSWLYQSSPRQSFVFGLGGGKENAKDKSEQYTHYYVRANWSRKWQSLKDLSTTISANMQKRSYKEADIFNIKRRDNEYFTRISASHPKLSWRGFTPRLNWTWSRTNSNHFYYRHNQNQVFMDIYKQF